jgi:hypothetical protein
MRSYPAPRGASRTLKFIDWVARIQIAPRDFK